MAMSNYQDVVPGGDAPSSGVAVWDVFVRVFHWSLVAAFIAAFITAEEWDRAHEFVGYAATLLVGLRIVWGFIGTKHARFADFVKGPAQVVAFLRDMRLGVERRYLGHNPAGGLMILALLSGILGLGCTGYMLTLDGYKSAEWLEELHEIIANGMLVLIALHIGGVVVASFRHGENLVAAMLSGRKRPE